MSRPLWTAELWAQRVCLTKWTPRAVRFYHPTPRVSRLRGTAGPRPAGRAAGCAAAPPTPLQQLGVGLEPAAARRVAQLAQRLGLDLADALARHVEERAHLLEGALRAVLGEPEA